MKYLFIMNPGSRSGGSRGRFQEITGILDAAKITYDVQVTQSLEEAYQMSLAGNRAGYEVIVAVGGDGTINRVLNGFYGPDGKRLSQAKMGVVYTGTSPDFCKSYGIPVCIREAVHTVLENKTKKIQVGRMVCATACREEWDGKSVGDGEVGDGFITRYFACCANIGLGAAMARRANSGIRGILGDRLGTFIALLGTLLSYQPEDFILCRDGKPDRVTKVYNISVGRIFYIASGIKVRHDLIAGDGRFYRLIVRDLTLKDLPGVIRKVYSGAKIRNQEKISLDYLKTIEVFGNSRNPEIEFDGDPAGFLPCRISMACDELDVIYREKDETQERARKHHHQG